MKSLRMLAGVLYACGLLSLWLGLEGISRAQTCTEVVWTSATCTGAKTRKPFENASGSYCEWVNNNCQATANSSCADRWGFAISGDCVPEPIGTSTTHSCYENAFATLVNLTWYTAHCEQENGDCDCVWEDSGTTNPVQVCDCYDTKNHWW